MLYLYSSRHSQDTNFSNKYQFRKISSVVSSPNTYFIVNARLQPLLENSRSKRGWLVDCLGFDDPLRQYFSLYRAVSQKEGERKEKG